MTAPMELTPEQETQFLAEAAEAGKDPQVARDVLQIISKLAPPIQAVSVKAFGLPLGEGSFRVAREYDTEVEAFGHPGYTEFILHTQLGLVRFSVPREAVIAALTVEVPHVPPQATPDNS